MCTAVVTLAAELADALAIDTTTSSASPDEQAGAAYHPCPLPIQHKNLVVNPGLLASLAKEHGLRVTAIRQEPGDFVITHPGAVHEGFNAGMSGTAWGVSLEVR